MKQPRTKSGIDTVMKGNTGEFKPTRMGGGANGTEHADI